MWRRGLLAGLLLVVAGAGVAAAQDGYYLGSRGNGPEFGLLFRVGRQLWLEPGLYVSVDRYHEDSDSSDFRGRFLALGVAGQLLWTGHEAVVTPVGGLRASIGRSWNHQETVNSISALSYSYVSDYPAMVYRVGAHAGVQIRMSDRAALSFEYVVQGSLTDGTFESTTDYGGLQPVATSTESRTDTELWNSFTFTVRIFRGAR